MGPLGWQETVFIFVLALLIFGPKKLPELGKTVGKALTEFRRASSELKATWDREMSSMERENESLKEVTKQYDPEQYNYDYNSYDSGYYDSGSSDSTASQTSTGSASAPEGTVPTESSELAAANGDGPQPAVEQAQVEAEAPAIQPAESKQTATETKA